MTSQLNDQQHRSIAGKFLTDDRGLTITEYAIAAGLIAATLAGSFGSLGMAIDAIIIAVLAFL